MATASSVDRNFPTLRRLTAPFRWFFRSRRRVLTTLAMLAAMIAALPLWWSIQLMGLPDIGEPFDVAAYRALTIPDDRNAFVLYRQAADRLKSLDSMRSKDESTNPRDPWPRATPTVRRWLDENREVLELFRRGSERPDALPPTGPAQARVQSLWGSFSTLKDLALLEASRLEEAGDMAGAWTWYRAVLREAALVGRRGSLFERNIGLSLRSDARDRLNAWVADTRTTSAMLRRALDDVIACEALAPSEDDSLRADYLLEGRLQAGYQTAGRERMIWQWKTVRLFSEEYQIDPEIVATFVDAWRWWRREPERSRRVLRLATANWLAYYDLPPSRRPARDPNTPGAFPFYAFGPEAPPGARALPPAALSRWLQSAADAQEALAFWDSRGLRGRELNTHRGLVLLVAAELYRRDHGSYPAQDEQLVGPYLKNLPDDGLNHPAPEQPPQE
jgi:hypothetical protein